ncbi:MAG: diguanylate cyclase [Alphaproteobacteria bacterium]|nr:diguanylate cyclase [Alphaproteobacteria bacterium]
MPHSAHVLVAAADDADRGRLAVTLADNGYRVSAASTGRKALALVGELKPDVVVLGPSLPDVELSAIAADMKAGDDPAGAARIVVVAPGISDAMRGACVGAGADDVVEGPIHPAVVLARMKPLCRLSTMQNELRQRLATAKAMGIDTVADPLAFAPAGACNVMVVAKPGGTTERAVRSALDGGFALTMESDPYRAGTKAESERFDAMVLAADGRRAAAEPMLYLASHLRNNPSLFNLPVMMLHAPGVFADDGDPYRYGASMAMGLPLEKAALASGIQILVRRQRARWAMRQAFDTVFHAVAPGRSGNVYPQRFFDPHLARLVEAAHREGRHLSIVHFALHNLEDIKRKHFAGAGEILAEKVANWVTGLVRIEDMVARVGEDGLCVVLPDTAQDEAAAMAQRIGAILSASEFHLGEEVMHPIKVWVDGGSAALESGDTAKSLVERARSTIFPQ